MSASGEFKSARYKIRNGAARGDETPAEPPLHKRDRLHAALSAADGALDLGAILTSVNETGYRWNLRTDEIIWQRNAGDVLGVADMSALASGRAFNLRIAPDCAGRRFEAISGARELDRDGGGVSYRVKYCFLPNGRRGGEAIWLEDHGRYKE